MKGWQETGCVDKANRARKLTKYIEHGLTKLTKYIEHEFQHESCMEKVLAARAEAKQALWHNINLYEPKYKFI